MATSTLLHIQQFITFKFSPNQVAKKQVSCLFRSLFHRDWVEKKVVLDQASSTMGWLLGPDGRQVIHKKIQ